MVSRLSGCAPLLDRVALQITDHTITSLVRLWTGEEALEPVAGPWWTYRSQRGCGSHRPAICLRAAHTKAT